MRAIKGKDWKKSEMSAMPMDSMSYPHFSIGLEHLPEAKDWKVGKTYMITLKAKQSGMHMSKSKDGKEHGSVEFDVMGIDPKGEAKGEKPKRYEE